MGWDPGCWVVLLMGPKKHKAVEKKKMPLLSDLGVLSCGGFLPTMTVQWWLIFFKNRKHWTLRESGGRSRDRFLGFHKLSAFFESQWKGRMFFFLTTSTTNPISLCRRVSDHLLEGSDLARLCGLFLPVAKVPSTARVAEVCQMG